MALSIQDSRILWKRSTVTTETPTAAPSNDFTDGTWTKYDIYIGESYANTIDEKLWFRFNSNIRQIAVADSPTTNRLTYWDVSGHLGNVSSPTDGYYLKYSNASGYIWASAGGAETQTWANVLTLGASTSGTSPIITEGDTLLWRNADATFTTTLSNNQTTAANRTVYLPKFDGTLAYHTSALTSGRITFATTNGALTDSSSLTTDATTRLYSKSSTADSTTYGLKVDNSAGTQNFGVRSDGRVAINTTSPLAKFHCQGDFYFEDNTYYFYSLGALTNRIETNFYLSYTGASGGRFITTSAAQNLLMASVTGGGLSGYWNIYNQNFQLASTDALDGQGVLTIANATAPTTNLFNGFRLYSADVVAGNAAPHFRTENGSIIKLYQETTGVGASTLVSNGGTTLTDTDTFDGYTLKQIVKALRNTGLLA